MKMHHLTTKETVGAVSALISWFESQDICMHDAVNVMTIVMARAIWEIVNHDRGRANEIAENIQNTLKEHNQQFLRDDIDKFFKD